jgi:RNA polymerase sigma-70 factor, ECF subfamily
VSSLAADVLKKLKARDRGLLESVFREVNPYLLRVLAAQGIFREHAEELVQAAWETFFANLDKFEGRSQIRVFIAGILLNKVREHRRAQGRVVVTEDVEHLTPDAAFAPDGHWIHAPGDPHKLAESKEMLGFLQDCLDGLTASQRDAFLLRESEGEISENICKILGVSVTNLGVLLFRAKDKLRRCLEGKVNALP